MTLLNPPAYLQAGTYTALLDRQHLITTLTTRDIALNHGARQGFYQDRFPGYSNPSGMNWVVGSCAGVIANTFTVDGGDYRFANPTNVTGSFAAASPTQNRYDILGFQVKDNFYDSSGLNQVVPAVIQGTNSSGTPVDPSLPLSFIPVLRAVINAGASTPVLQDLRQRTGVPGGVLTMLNVTERNALGAVHHGFTVWRNDLRVFEMADGAGGWRVPNTVVVADNAALTAAITTPYVGQQAYRTDGAQLYTRDTDSQWKPTKVVGARRLVGVGTQYTLSGTTETAMPKFSFSIPVVNGRWYKLNLAVFLSAPGAVGNSFVFRVRRNTVGGTFITEWLKRSEQDAAFDEDFTGSRLWKATATEVITFVVTGFVAAGAGQLRVRGGTGTSGESMFWAEDAGQDPNVQDVA